MDAEKLNQALYDKMAAEQKEYRSWLLEQTPEEILNHAFEYSVREDILIEAEVLDLCAPEAAALLESPAPLADIFKNFRDMETGHMDTIRECIEQRADSLLEAQREKHFVPIYQESLRYARENGEMEQWQASLQANVACRDAIDSAIREGFDGMYLTADVKGVLAEFGPERVTLVLASTLQARDGDQRFSRSNQAWAAAVPMVNTENRRFDYVLNTHSAVLDGYVNKVRKELSAMREQPEKKPSIKKQLAAKPVPGDQSAKPKGREAR